MRRKIRRQRRPDLTLGAEITETEIIFVYLTDVKVTSP
jgi:hypothetical protein